MTESDNSPKEDCITSVRKFAGHGSMVFESAWAQPMDIERASVCRALAMAKI